VARQIGAYGVYELALNAITRLRTTEAGDTLADFVRDETATVQAQVFPAKLVGAVLKVQDAKLRSLMQDQSSGFVSALVNLAALYAKALKRIAPEVAAEQPISCLRTIWLAQSESALLAGAGALQQAFAEVPNPLRAVNLMRQLLEAAGQIEGWNNQLRDPKFVDGLINLALEYSKLDPRYVTLYVEESQQPFNAFLNTLWHEYADIRQGARELYQFFEPFTTPEKRSQVLKLSCSLLEAARKADALQEVRQNAKVLNHLLDLGREYAAIEPSEPEENPRYFLTTLWKASSDHDVQVGIGELGDFFTEVVTPATLLRFKRSLFRVLSSTAVYRHYLKELSFWKDIAVLAHSYTRFRATELGQNSSNDLLANIWHAESAADVERIAASIQIPAEGRFNDERSNLYDFIANGPITDDERDYRSKAVIGNSGFRRVRRPADVTVRFNPTLLLRDTQYDDGDAVSISVNGRDLGSSFPISTSSFTRIPLRLEPGINSITIRAVSEGSQRPTTVQAIIQQADRDRNDPRNRGDYIFSTNLRVNSEFGFTISFAQIPVDPELYPEVARHTLDAWSYGYPRILTVDRIGGYTRRGLTKADRSTASISRYLSDPRNPRRTFYEEYDEYPQALFAENGGTAHVRPLDARQNEGAGASVGGYARNFRDGERIEIITGNPDYLGQAQPDSRPDGQ